MTDLIGRICPQINLFFYLSCAAVFTASTAVGCARATPATETPPVVKIVKPMPTLALSERFNRTQDVYCLSLAVYGEARNQSELGQRAVAETIMNRVDSKYYPASVCGVVFQRKQFSFLNENDPNRDKAFRAFDEDTLSPETTLAIHVAIEALDRPADKRIAKGLHYLTAEANPRWRASMPSKGKVQIDQHVFYASKRP